MSFWESVQASTWQLGTYFSSIGGIIVLGFTMGVAGLLLLHRIASADEIKRHAQKALRDILKQAADKLGTMQAERDGARTELRSAQSELDVARPDRLALEDLRERLVTMKRVWIEEDSYEEDCCRVLAQNLWVLSPDYICLDPSGLSLEVALNTILSQHLETSAANINGLKTPINPNWRADLCGWVTSGSALDTAPEVAQRFYLLIEMKASQMPIKYDEIDQVHAYAYALMLLAPEKMWGKRIDCLVIGKEVVPGILPATLRWGPTPDSAVRVIPMTFRQLFRRAQLIAWTFLPSAPETEMEPDPPSVMEPTFSEPSGLPDPRIAPEPPRLPAPAIAAVDGASEPQIVAPEAVGEEPLELTEVEEEGAAPPPGALTAPPQSSAAQESADPLYGWFARTFGRHPD